MNTRSRITKLIAITMAVAAIAVIGSSWAAGPACAAGQVAMGDGSVRFISPPIGFIPGQRLSLSVLYPNEEGSRPARVQAYIYDSAGNLLSQTDPVELRPGRFHTFHFDIEVHDVQHLMRILAALRATDTVSTAERL